MEEALPGIRAGPRLTSRFHRPTPATTMSSSTWCPEETTAIYEQWCVCRSWPKNFCKTKKYSRRKEEEPAIFVDLGSGVSYCRPVIPSLASASTPAYHFPRTREASTRHRGRTTAKKKSVHPTDPTLLSSSSGGKKKLVFPLKARENYFSPPFSKPSFFFRVLSAFCLHRYIPCSRQ